MWIKIVKVPKKKVENDQLFKLSVGGREENCADKFMEVCDEASDSEIEHISEASEDDDNELSFDIDDIPLIYLRKKKSVVRGTNVRVPVEKSALSLRN